MEKPESKVRFGPAGIPIGCEEGTTEAGIAFCAKIGLEAMEVEFVRGARMAKEKAEACRKVREEKKIVLSAHCPYWINCCAKEPEKLAGSVRHLTDTARIMAQMGGGVIVFHPGYYMERPPQECAKLAIKTLETTLEKMAKEKIGKGAGVILGAELTGKHSAYGNLEEIIALSEHFGLETLQPVVDYAHYHARIKKLKTEDDFRFILDALEKKLGAKAVHSFHCHFSEINYTDAGERNHLALGSNHEPPFELFAKVLAENGYAGTVICETPLLEQDALKMQEMYSDALKKTEKK